MIDVITSTKKLSKNEWLNWRKKGIGGSDVATICGLNKYKSPLQLWLEKTEQVEPVEAGEAAYFGTLLEPVVRDEFTRRSGLRVETINSMLKHPVFEFMLANVDGVVIDQDNSKAIFEAKTASVFKSEQWEDNKIPEEYMLQIQHYMAVTGFNKTYIACLLGGNKFIYKLIERDDELIDMIIQLEYNFWECVKSNVPPKIDGSESCSELMSRLYPNANNGSSIILPDEAQQLVDQYNSSKEQEKLFSEKKDEAANMLKQMLGDNEVGVINDIKVSWKNVITERLDTKKLKAENPEIYGEYVSSSSSRRFSIK
ncbi:MAG: YqaJ viral recombinase family protein [Vulcanibacillus sp.]